ncbi:SAE2-domain-containing protein [Hypoxylon crocopeplum]|nr:SAE2-domain-containing protein [Hypoxylon crocopeplum]
MESWFKEVGRPALFDALAGVCDRLDNELDGGLKSYMDENARLSTELERLRSKVQDVDRLEGESRSLKRELQTLKDACRADASMSPQSKSHEDTRNFRTPLAPKSVNQVLNSKPFTKSGDLIVDGLKFSELKEDYLVLDGNYTKLREKYVELEDAHAQLNQRLRDKTKAYNQWVNHAHQLDELCKKRIQTIKKLEAKLEATVAAASGPLDASSSSDTAARPVNIHQATTSEFVDADALSKPVLARPTSTPGEVRLIWPSTNVNDAGREAFKTAPPKQTRMNESGPLAGQRGDITPSSHSDVSTEDGGASTLPPLPKNRGETQRVVLIKNEPSSDIPVIVSERCLRKRKHGEGQIGDIRTSPKFKTEYGSDPLVTDERRHFVARESVDFDAEGSRVDTPRKRNRTNREIQEVSILDSVETPQSHTSTSILAAQDDHLVQETGRRGDIPSRIFHNEDSGAAHVNGHASAQSLELLGNRFSISSPSGRNSKLKQWPEINPLAKRKMLSSGRNGLADLAEDGERYGVLEDTTRRGSTTDRLQGLLNAPAPGPEAITPRPGARSDRMSTSNAFEFQVPQRRDLPFGNGNSKKASKISQPHGAHDISNKQTPTNVNAKRVSDDRATGGLTGNARPLRQRPRSELSLADFKVNPEVNEGIDFAYTDVIRNKDERASLAGCVQEACCGQTFRLQARAKRDQTSSSDFQALLENYLGDDAWKLAAMVKPEKEELWLEAKTRELANEHGRHRHRYHRAASPAGFWRADFPSTQEEQREREERAKMTRRMVDERYREAMRPGGRYLFRDE